MATLLHSLGAHGSTARLPIAVADPIGCAYAITRAAAETGMQTEVELAKHLGRATVSPDARIGDLRRLDLLLASTVLAEQIPDTAAELQAELITSRKAPV